MTQCEYIEYYQCKNEAEEGSRFCSKCLEKKCVVCGEQATHDCPYEGQFVCGEPLCDECKGYNDMSKDAGGWGFKNHSHRRILDHESSNQ